MEKSLIEDFVPTMAFEGIELVSMEGIDDGRLDGSELGISGCFEIGEGLMT